MTALTTTSTTGFLTRLARALSASRRDERGMSEAATAILVLPFIAALIFLLVEVGFHIRTRTVIDNIVADTTRAAALEGGNRNPRTTLVADPGGWAAVGTAQLVRACQSRAILVRNPCTPASLTIVCTPTVATQVGQNVTCEIPTTKPVLYKTLSPMSSTALFSFGFSGLFTAPIAPRSTAAAAVGTTG